MKSNFKLFLLFAAMGALGWVGCQTQFPTSYISPSAPSSALVINFENGLAISPNLAEANVPANKLQSPGMAVVSFQAPMTTTTAAVTTVNAGVTTITAPVTTIVDYGGGTGNIVSPGAAGTSFSMSVTGTVKDHSDGKYPTAQLQLPLEGPGNMYDASFFTGVKFYLKVPGDDTATTKTFSIPVAQTQPPSAGGTCNQGASSNACYNNFAVTYSTTNGWQLMTVPFSTMTRGTYGASITPSTLSGVNLQQALMLDWSEGNQNAGGNAHIDFYVDEVEFY